MTLKRLIAWAKLIGTIAIILFVLLFMIVNREPVRINFLFAKTPELPKFVLIITSANLGVLVFLIMSRLRRVLADIHVGQKKHTKIKPPVEEAQTGPTAANTLDKPKDNL